jgi:integrase
MIPFSYTVPARLLKIKDLRAQTTQILHRSDIAMTFVIDSQELKPGLVIFHRGDVQHQNWYCRIKIPDEDRYKTVSLKTSDINTAKERAFDYDADIRFRIKHDVPVFNRPFSQVGTEYVNLIKDRCEAGQISPDRWKKVKSIIDAQLNRYAGNIQINLVGQDRWDGYPVWRQKNGKGRNGRVSDASIRSEMSVFRSVMAYAAKKKYISSAQVFEGKLPISKARREEFTPEEYRKLHTFARGWIKEAKTPGSAWYRTVAYNFILIMSNTGMRPPEAKNLRWRDLSVREDKQGRKFVVLHVRGKDKFRNLVAAGNVADYFERIRAIGKATGDDDFIFTNVNGKRALSLYASLIESVLTNSGLLFSSSGSRRSTYCFRHTYATFRLSEGVDVYFLAKQMGTSVQMIEKHYGHINPVKNAERILQGLPGWEPITAVPQVAAEAGRVHADKAKTATGRRKPKAKLDS